MTRRRETDDFAASDSVRVVHRCLGRQVDSVVGNTAEPPADLAVRYADEVAFAVVPDLAAVRPQVSLVLPGSFAMTEPLIRHDAEPVVVALGPELAAD